MNRSCITRRVHNLNLSARSVILILAIGVDASISISRPLPDPVDSDGVASLVGSGNVDVSLAPLLNVGGRLAEDVVGELLLTLDGNGTSVDLMAAAVVVILSSDLRATRITAITGGVPLEDINNLLSI